MRRFLLLLAAAYFTVSAIGGSPLGAACAVVCLLAAAVKK